jgi:hypothetical protein
MKITIYSLAFNLIVVFMAKKGVSKNGERKDVNLEAAKYILAAVSNNQELSFGGIDISETIPDLVNKNIDKLLKSDKENPYSCEMIMNRRGFGGQEASGSELDKKLKEFQDEYLRLKNGASKQSASTLQNGVLPKVLGAGSVSSEGSRGSFERASSFTSEGSYNISDSNSSAKKKGIISRIKDSLAKICGGSKKEDSLHGSVTAEFVVNGGEKGVFARTEERMARDQEAKATRLEEQQKMKEEVSRRRQELEKQRKRGERLDQKAFQKSQAPEQRGPSMFEGLKNYWRGVKAPEVLVVQTHRYDRGDWHVTSTTKIGPEEVKEGAGAAVRGAKGFAKGSAQVAETIGRGVGYMMTGWEDATGSLDAAKAAAGLMARPGGSIGDSLTSVGAVAQFMAPSGPPKIPSGYQVAGAARCGAKAAAGFGSATGKFAGDVLRVARDTSVTFSLGSR